MHHPDQLQRILFVLRVLVVEEEHTSHLVVPRLQIVNVKLVRLAQQVNMKFQHAHPRRIVSAQLVERVEEELIQLVGVVVVQIEFVLPA